MKIFIGFNNVASQFFDLKRGFADLNIKSYTAQYYFSNNPIVNNEVDFYLPKMKGYIKLFRPYFVYNRIKPLWDKFVEKYIYKKAIIQCDVFIFLWRSFDEDFYDLKDLIKRGKKVICVFVGDDIRWYYGMKQEFSSYNLRPIEYPEYDYSTKGLVEKLVKLRNVEKNAHFIFSRLDQSQLSLRPYYRWNMMVYPKDYLNNVTQRKYCPKVAHAPSNRKIKGTDYILDVFEKLKNEGIPFEPVLIENMTHSEAIKEYGDADILIDQLLCPGTGKLATEALASGTIVMGLMAYDTYPQKNPADCPIIDVNPENLYNKLKDLILDYPFREEHAKKGRPYVEKYLDVKLFCQKVVDLANGVPKEPDYFPTFFRKQFVPESEESQKLYNYWNDQLQNCSWYKQYVAKGERDGLYF